MLNLMGATRRVLAPSVLYRRQSENAPLYGIAILILSIALAVMLWSTVPRWTGLHQASYPPSAHIIEAFVNLFDPPPNDFLAVYGFRNGQTIYTHFWATFMRVSLSVVIGASLGIALGMMAAVFAASTLTVLFWLYCYYGFPRLLELLFLTNLGVLSAGVILGSCAVMFTTGLATHAILSDDTLKDQVESGRLVTSSWLILVLAIGIPQRVMYISLAAMMGVVGAVSAVVFTEYMLAIPGLGYLFQITFGNHPLVAEAFAIGMLIEGIILAWCLLIAIAAWKSVPFWLTLSYVVMYLTQPRCRDR